MLFGLNNRVATHGVLLLLRGPYRALSTSHKNSLYSTLARSFAASKPQFELLPHHSSVSSHPACSVRVMASVYATGQVPRCQGL